MTTNPLPVSPHSGIVSVAELRAYMGRPNFTESQHHIAALTLIGVQQDLENHLNRPLELVQVREVRRSDNYGHVNTTISPIHKVISITALDNLESVFDLVQVGYTPTPEIMVRDMLVTADGRLLDHLYPSVGDPMIVPGGIYAGTYGINYAVEYVGGYNGYVNQGLKLDILRIAAREMAPNHTNSINLRDGNPQEVNPTDSRPSGWTKEELEGWDRLRRRVIA